MKPRSVEIRLMHNRWSGIDYWALEIDERRYGPDAGPFKYVGEPVRVRVDELRKHLDRIAAQGDDTIADLEGDAHTQTDFFDKDKHDRTD